jgi:hypothetical protein
MIWEAGMMAAEKSSIKVDEYNPTLYKQHPSAASPSRNGASDGSRRDRSLKTG